MRMGRSLSISAAFLRIAMVICSPFDLSVYYQQLIDVHNSSFYILNHKTNVSTADKLNEYPLLCLESGNNSSNIDILDNACDRIESDYCKYHRKDDVKTKWNTFGVIQDECGCEIGECQNKSMYLYPGCSCNKITLCDLNDQCEFWTNETNNENMKFETYNRSIKEQNFRYMAQTGATDLHFNNSVAYYKSKVFRQSGFNCTVLFNYQAMWQSSSSRVVLTAHMETGENITLWEVNEYSTIRQEVFFRFWTHASVNIGSFSRPFYLTLACDSGYPRNDNKTKKSGYFVCGLGYIDFSGCQNTLNPIEECSNGDQMICRTGDNTKCLQDIQCDLTTDCADGSDENDCGIMVNGSMCDFNNREVSNGWIQSTRFLDVKNIDDVPTTPPPINKIVDTPIHVFRTKVMTSKYGEKRYARKGSGSALTYESIKNRKLSERKSAFISPEFPRTNPSAYDPTSKLFKTCKLRFYICVHTTFSKWDISIISKSGSPFDSGKTILYDLDKVHKTDKTECVWNRASVDIPRQIGSYRIQIFVEHEHISNYFLAIDDLSFSPTCFEKDYNEADWVMPEMLVSSCGATGSERPSSCKKFRELDGQTGHFLKEDSTQEWTVPESGFYRFVACGGGGGSAGNKRGLYGQCAIFQVHLVQNLAVRMLVGQMGEHACYDNNQISSSCSNNNNQKKQRRGGGGGGGATLIKVESNNWNVVVGGGGGASDIMTDSNIDQLMAGYGASAVTIDYDDHCQDVCKSVTIDSFTAEKNQHICPGKTNSTVFGGFGGGGNSCGSIGGGGAGYRAGNPLGTIDERSGSSFVQRPFSLDPIYYQSNQVEDGFIKIKYCAKQCPFPSVCRFRGNELDEEYCGCSDGSEYQNTTDSCACTLDCPYASTCQFRNYTFEQYCSCNNGKLLNDMITDICEEKSHSWLITLLLAIVTCIATLFSCIYVRIYKARNEKMQKELIEFTMLKSSEYLYDDIYFGRQTRKEALVTLPLIDRDNMKFGRVLGKGNFGEVLYGQYESFQVAVKTISKPFSASASAQSDFCNEALCMGTFVHENIVRLIGVDFQKLPFLIAIEYMEGGDLLSFVKEARPNHISLNPFNLTMSELISIGCEVAAGCKCLEEFGYVHRDIAARNILLTTRASGRVAKIADFGMAKEITYGSEYYRVHGRAMLPIKWTPPEAFIDGVFTTKSDVWSFGVLCWEVFSLGVVPYPNRRNEEVMLMITEGARLEYPYGIPTGIYKMMRECWKTSPEDRPTFSDIVDILDGIAKDTSAIGMPFPIHPAVRASYAHAQTTPVSVETPQTAITEISVNSAFTEASTIRISNQQDIQDRMKLHEMMLIRETPYTSEMATCVVENLRRDLARTQYETGSVSIRQPEYLSPESSDESIQLLPHTHGGSCADQTPPTSLIDLNRLAVQDTGPTLQRPDCLNINDLYSSPLLG